MFQATSGEGEHSSDPDSVTVEQIDDGETKWIRIRWGGSDYEDGWFLAKKEDMKTLAEME